MGNRPIVFFGSVIHFGGAIKSTLALIEEINKTENIVVLDVCGYCKEYICELGKRNIRFEVLHKNFNSPIIGNHFCRKYLNMLSVSVKLYQVIKKLKSRLLELDPKIIWMNSERSMFTVGRAVGNKFPTLMFIRGKHSRIKWYCKRDWENLSLILGNNGDSLNDFSQFKWAANKLGVVHNGIDVHRIEELSCIEVDLPNINSGFKIILPATLIPLKNHEMAIRAFYEFQKSVSDSTLWICGDTPNKLSLDYEDHLRKICSELDISNKVCFLGWRDDIPSIISKSDVMILTSKTEGMPRSVLEAMALRIPVIATNVGGVSEIIVDKETGFLVKSGDYLSLYNSLIEMTDERLREKIGALGRQRALKEFSIDQKAKEFIGFVKKITRQ